MEAVNGGRHTEWSIGDKRSFRLRHDDMGAGAGGALVAFGVGGGDLDFDGLADGYHQEGHHECQP